MELLTGYFYFVSDKFFEIINDPFLKINYQTTKRPHYFAFKDKKTDLYWLVPCSSRVFKFEKIIQDKQAKGKRTDTIKIITLFDKKSVLLFQDMFPVIGKYIDEPYIKGGQIVRITDPKLIVKLEKTARKVMHLLHKGIKFTPTQPNILLIEKLMIDELNKYGENAK